MNETRTLASGATTTTQLVRQFQTWTAPLVGIVLLLGQVIWFWHATIEDAYISYRYARNWAEGLGFVFNAGEAVEGYSNFSWTLLLGIATWLGRDLLTASKVLGVAATLTLITLVYLGARRMVGPQAGAWAVLLLGASTALAFWTVAGLEITLYAACIAAALYLFLTRQNHGARLASLYALPLAGAALTRPEGLGLIVIFLGLDVWKRRMRTAVIAALLFLALYAPLLVWRWLTYDALLPNSLQAKAAFFTALESQPRHFMLLSLTYVLNWAVKWGLIWWIPLAWFARHDAASLPLALVLAYVGGVALLGAGDWMPLQRLWLPAVAAWAWLAVLGWNKWQRQHGVLASLFLVLLIVSQFDLSAFQSLSRNTRHLDHWWQERMHSLATLAQDEETPLATTVLGRTGYYFPGPVLDAFGLADVHIARHGDPAPRLGRTDWEYVLQREPVFVLINDPQPSLRSQMADYYWLPIETPPDFPVILLVRSDRADAAAENLDVIRKPADDPGIDALIAGRLAERRRQAMGPTYQLCVTESPWCHPLWLILKP